MVPVEIYVYRVYVKDCKGNFASSLDSIGNLEALDQRLCEEQSAPVGCRHVTCDQDVFEYHHSIYVRYFLAIEIW